MPIARIANGLINATGKRIVSTSIGLSSACRLVTAGQGSSNRFGCFLAQERFDSLDQLSITRAIRKPHPIRIKACSLAAIVLGLHGRAYLAMAIATSRALASSARCLPW